MMIAKLGTSFSKFRRPQAFFTIVNAHARFVRGIILYVFSLVLMGSAAADRALLLGVSETPGLSPEVLDGPETDVLLMDSFLREELGFDRENILILTNAEVTKANAINAIENWLIDGTSAGDRVFFYWSGHGSQLSDISGDEPDGLDETLVTYDFSSGQSLSDDELNALFSRIPDRQITMVVDACHSGTIRRGDPSFDPNQPTARKASVADPVPIYQETNEAIDFFEPAFRDVEESNASIVVWSASASGQLAYTDNSARPPRGLFTQGIIDGMRQSQADFDRSGLVTNSELLTFVRSRSDQFCGRWSNVCDLGLTPELELIGSRLTSPAFNMRVQSEPISETSETANEAIGIVEPDAEEVEQPAGETVDPADEAPTSETDQAQTVLADASEIEEAFAEEAPSPTEIVSADEVAPADGNPASEPASDIAETIAEDDPIPSETVSINEVELSESNLDSPEVISEPVDTETPEIEEFTAPEETMPTETVLADETSSTEIDQAPPGLIEEAQNDPPAEPMDEVDFSSGIIVPDVDESTFGIALDSERYLFGDTFSIQVSTESAGELMLISVDSEGSARVLYPNPYSRLMGQSTFVEAGSNISFPASGTYSYIATEPAGETEIIGIFTEPGIDIDALVKSTDWTEIDDKSDFIDRVAAALQSVVFEDANGVITDRSKRSTPTVIRSTKWDMDTASFVTNAPAETADSP